MHNFGNQTTVAQGSVLEFAPLCNEMPTCRAAGADYTTAKAAHACAHPVF